MPWLLKITDVRRRCSRLHGGKYVAPQFLLRKTDLNNPIYRPGYGHGWKMKKCRQALIQPDFDFIKIGIFKIIKIEVGVLMQKLGFWKG